MDQTRAPSDPPNMGSVADETLPYTHPRARYRLARLARAAQAEGAARRRAG